MNYTGTHQSNSKTTFGSDAAALASLTRELAHCCISKESELFQRFGLTSSEGVVLLQVAETGTALPSGLACTLRLARSRMTPLTANLVEKGFLSRRESATDRRVRELSLTEKGQQVASAAHGCRMDFHSRLLESYSESERAALLNTLTTLRKYMDDLHGQISRESSTSQQN
jgi:DNA-binding MarR family transcriptional regulator